MPDDEKRITDFDLYGPDFQPEPEPEIDYNPTLFRSCYQPWAPEPLETKQERLNRTRPNTKKWKRR